MRAIAVRSWYDCMVARAADDCERTVLMSTSAVRCTHSLKCRVERLISRGV